MKFLLKNRWHIAGLLLISLIYFSLRLLYLKSLPIFTDEAIYIRWSQIALHDSSWRFISLTDGKQPMFVWFALIFIKFINDPLIAGRLVSVFTGFLTMIGIFVLSYELFKNKNLSFLTSVLYVFYPFAQVLDRMALYDSMVATFSIWALYFSIFLVKRVRLDIAYTLGFIIGGGILTKSSNFFSIYLLPFTLLLFDYKKKPVLKRFSKLIAFMFIAVVVGFSLYNILRLSPLFQMITAKNAIFVYPFSEWIRHPLTFFIGNLHGLFSWLFQYLTIFYLFLIIVALFLIKQNFKEKLLLFIYFLLPFAALALFGKVIFPRFIFFMSLYLLILAGWGLNYLINFLIKYITKINHKYSVKLAYIIISFLFIVYPAYVSIQFAVNPVSAKIADADSSQYVNSWASGWGVKESVDFFKKQSEDRKIYIATEGTFGLLPESMEIYLVSNKNISIKGFWPVDIFPQEVLIKATIMPTYFIFYQHEHEIIPPAFPLKLLFKVKQGTNNSFYRVYQVVPK